MSPQFYPKLVLTQRRPAHSNIATAFLKSPCWPQPTLNHIPTCLVKPRGTTALGANGLAFLDRMKDPNNRPCSASPLFPEQNSKTRKRFPRQSAAFQGVPDPWRYPSRLCSLCLRSNAFPETNLLAQQPLKVQNHRPLFQRVIRAQLNPTNMSEKSNPPSVV